MNDKYQAFLDWVIYQIYPRSFCDSNADGIGDINGIRQKLDYLCDLGVNALWLCPCYKSPNHDNGYDIADYHSLAPEFGTMDDMCLLIDDMHRRGMKLIMDFVPNHTSDEHPWFLASKQSRNNPYSDYYYWYDRAPNDWESMFGGSAWAYCPERDQYYLHSYTAEQPDLNWDNPQVRREMQNIIDFWVDKGVDGFRCDVIDQISKSIEEGKNCFGPHLHQYIHALFGRQKTEGLFTVGECWTSDIEEIKRHTAESRGELSTLFQFDHLSCGRSGHKFNPGEGTMKALAEAVIQVQMSSNENDLLHTLFTDNHDNNYLLSRVGNDREYRYESATAIATLVYLMKGIPVVYQGQEYGCIGSQFDTISDFNDVESIHYYNSLVASGMSWEEAMKHINFGSRDNARRPMAWDESQGHGFSTVQPWLTFSNHANRINISQDATSKRSIGRFYRDLLRLRKEHSTLRHGAFARLSKPDAPYLVYERKDDHGSFTVVINYETQSRIPAIWTTGQLVLSNAMQPTDTLFDPYQVAVYQTE